jgi:hypothetical protein
LTPTGNIGFISDDLARFGFDFEAESDHDDHPNSPYGLLTLIGES